MPKLKKSLGWVSFVTTFPDEFQRYLFYELANHAHWNKKTTNIETAFYRWSVKSENGWKIWFDGKEITAESNEPKIWIRKGLEINMGNGTIVISCANHKEQGKQNGPQH